MAWPFTGSCPPNFRIGDNPTAIRKMGRVGAGNAVWPELAIRDYARPSVCGSLNTGRFPGNQSAIWKKVCGIDQLL
jgi:hypothetical protein